MELAQHPEAAALRNPCRQYLKWIEAGSVIPEPGVARVPLRIFNGNKVAKSEWHYGCHISVGSLVISAGIGLSITTAVDSQLQPTVLLGYDGDAMLKCDEHVLPLRAGDCLILSGLNPEEPTTWHSNLYSIVAIRLDQQRLQQTVRRMGVGTAAGIVGGLPLDHVPCWSPPMSDLQVMVQAMLREVIETATKLLSFSPILPEKLHLDEQIYRLLAVMLVPDLAQESAFDRLRLRESQGRDAFDELIDYIKDNLDQPLNLTLLESRSNYSRRALQYAFRERLGCTATQWIRGQRLDLARQLLEQPRPEDSVASIAVASGYRSLSLFSVDFQQRFHLKPSDLLREARASMGQARRAADATAPAPVDPATVQIVDTRAPRP